MVDRPGLKSHEAGLPGEQAAAKAWPTRAAAWLKSPVDRMDPPNFSKKERSKIGFNPG